MTKRKHKGKALRRVTHARVKDRRNVFHTSEAWREGVDEMLAAWSGDAGRLIGFSEYMRAIHDHIEVNSTAADAVYRALIREEA